MTRAAASSIASGSPSTRLTMSATAGSVSAVRLKSGLMACARSAKSRTAPDALASSTVVEVLSDSDEAVVVTVVSGEPEADTAGDQERCPGASVQEIAQPWSRGDHLLEVIQDQEQAPVGQHVDQAVAQGLGAHVAQPK